MIARVALVLLFVVVIGGVAEAHPGRLDSSGCHDVHKDFHYADGRVTLADTRHCHPKETSGTAALWFGNDSIELPDTTPRHAPLKEPKEVESP